MNHTTFTEEIAMPAQTDAMIARLEVRARGAQRHSSKASSAPPRRPTATSTSQRDGADRRLRGRIGDARRPARPAARDVEASRSSPATGPARSTTNCRPPAARAGLRAPSSTARPARTSPTGTWRRWATTAPCPGIEVFHRAAAHQTTADNPGLLPESIVAPIVNFVDTSRPIVSAIGPQDLGTGVMVVRPGHPAHPGRRAVGGEDRAGQSARC